MTQIKMGENAIESAKKVMRPEDIGGGGGQPGFNYTAMLMAQSNQIRLLFTQCAGNGFNQHTIEATEAALMTLHSMTQAYHYDDYSAAYKKIMGTLKVMDLRDRGKRRLYFDWLQAWFGSLMHQLKRMGVLMERQGILDFE